MKNFEKFLTKKNIFFLVLIVVLLYFSDVFTGSMREGAHNMNTKIKILPDNELERKKKKIIIISNK